MLNYMRQRNIDKNLQIEIIKYLDFLDEMDRESNLQGQKIMLKLSKNLQD